MANPRTDILLTYGDTVITKREMELLQPGEWLNDTLIEFYFEYLQRTIKSEKLLFVGPSTAFFINQCDDPATVRETLESIGADKKEVIFLPINNNANRNQAGGSHWSLLVLDRKQGAYHYYDSMAGCSLPVAAETARTLEAALLAPAEDMIVHKGPQQSNSSDCGVFLLATAELLGQRVDLGADVTPVADGWLREMVTADFAAQLRKKMAKLILEQRA